MFENHLQYISIYYSVEEHVLIKAHQSYTFRRRVLTFSIVEVII